MGKPRSHISPTFRITAKDIAPPLRSQILEIASGSADKTIDNRKALEAINSFVAALRQAAEGIAHLPDDIGRKPEKQRALAFKQVEATLDFLGEIEVHPLIYDGLQRLLMALGNVEKGSADALLTPKISIQKAPGYPLVAAKAYVAAAVWLLQEHCGFTRAAKAANCIAEALPEAGRLVQSKVRTDKAAAAGDRVLDAFEWVRAVELKANRGDRLDRDQEHALDIYSEQLNEYQSRLALTAADDRRQLIVAMLRAAIAAADHMLMSCQD